MHRIHHGKKIVRVFDYVDALVPMLTRMYEKRLKGYRVIGYEMESDPLRLTFARCAIYKSHVFSAHPCGPLHLRQVRGLTKISLKRKEIWSGRGDSNARPPAPKADSSLPPKYPIFNRFVSASCGQLIERC